MPYLPPSVPDAPATATAPGSTTPGAIPATSAETAAPAAPRTPRNAAGVSPAPVSREVGRTESGRTESGRTEASHAESTGRTTPGIPTSPTTLTEPPAPARRAPVEQPAAPPAAPEPDSGRAGAPKARPGTPSTPTIHPDAGTGPATQPATVPPEFDLATARPGGRIRALLDQVRQERSERLGSRLQRRSEQEKSWRVDLAGEKRVGSELHRLKRHGWYVLHSIPLSGTEDIDHLLVGPGGVFAIATRHHPGQAVRVDDDTVRIGSGTAQAHHLADDTDAARVREVIARHCEFTFQVQRVVVYVGVTELTVEATRLPARLYQERQVSALGPLTGALTPAQVAHVHRVARDRRTWTAAS
nr:nuclease-related domain-containing protein [Streptomyces sp. YIM 130001]